MMDINNDNKNTVTQKDKDKNYFILMTLEDEKGENRQIKIYKDSDPSELAFDFCKINNLDFNSLKFIKSNIKKTKQRFYEEEKKRQFKFDNNYRKNKVGTNEQKEPENIVINAPNLEIINEEPKIFIENKNRKSTKKDKENSKLKKINKVKTLNSNFKFGEAYINDRGEKIWVSEKTNSNNEEEDELSELSKLSKLKNSNDSNLNFIGFGDNYINISQKVGDTYTIKNEISTLNTKNMNSFDIKKATTNRKKKAIKNVKTNNSKTNKNNKKKCVVKVSKIPKNMKRYQTYNECKISDNNENSIENNKNTSINQQFFSNETYNESESLNKKYYLSPLRYFKKNPKNKEISNYYLITKNIMPQTKIRHFPINKAKYKSSQKMTLHDLYKEQKEAQKENQSVYGLSEILNLKYDDFHKYNAKSDKNNPFIDENSNNSVSNNKKILNNSNKIELFNNNSINIKNDNISSILGAQGNSSYRLHKKNQKCRIASYKTNKFICDSTPSRSELRLPNMNKFDSFKNKLYNSNSKGDNNTNKILNGVNKSNKINKTDNSIKGDVSGSQSQTIFINTPNNRSISPFIFSNYNFKNTNFKTQNNNSTNSFEKNENTLNTSLSKDGKFKTSDTSNKKKTAKLDNTNSKYNCSTNKKKSSKTTQSKIITSKKITRRQISNKNLNKTSKFLTNPLDIKVEDFSKYNLTSVSDNKNMPKIERESFSLKEFYNKCIPSKKDFIEAYGKENTFQNEKSDIEEKIKQILNNVDIGDNFKKSSVSNKKDDSTLNILEKIFYQLDLDNDGIINLNKNTIYGYLNILFPGKIKKVFTNIIDLIFIENKQNITFKNNGEQVLTMDMNSFFNYIFLIIYILSFED